VHKAVGRLIQSIDRFNQVIDRLMDSSVGHSTTSGVKRDVKRSIDRPVVVPNTRMSTFHI
jgi:hypothetical protein